MKLSLKKQAPESGVQRVASRYTYDRSRDFTVADIDAFVADDDAETGDDQGDVFFALRLAVGAW